MNFIQFISLLLLLLTAKKIKGELAPSLPPQRVPDEFSDSNRPIEDTVTPGNVFSPGGPANDPLITGEPA